MHHCGVSHGSRPPVGETRRGFGGEAEMEAISSNGVLRFAPFCNEVLYPGGDFVSRLETALLRQCRQPPHAALRSHWRQSRDLPPVAHPFDSAVPANLPDCATTASSCHWDPPTVVRPRDGQQSGAHGAGVPTSDAGGRSMHARKGRPHAHRRGACPHACYRRGSALGGGGHNSGKAIAVTRGESGSGGVHPQECSSKYRTPIRG
jgi:hypothetical protein